MATMKERLAENRFDTMRARRNRAKPDYGISSTELRQANRFQREYMRAMHGEALRQTLALEALAKTKRTPWWRRLFGDA